jgi:flagellar P-ring protein precursor FlgI
LIRFIRLLALALPLAAALPADAQVRIKDIADVEGIRENQLIGYGLVVGLAGTGDRRPEASGAPSVLRCSHRRDTFVPSSLSIFSGETRVITSMPSSFDP